MIYDMIYYIILHFLSHYQCTCIMVIDLLHQVLWPLRGSGQHLWLVLLLNDGEVRLPESQRIFQPFSNPILSCTVSLCSLRSENCEVWTKVVRLNQDIEQEKKKSEELELRLRNAERSREDLEKKTKVLEEEIKNLTKSMSKTGAKTN